MKNYFLNSVLAGFAIAMGGWAYLMAPNPIVGALILNEQRANQIFDISTEI